MTIIEILQRALAVALEHGEITRRQAKIASLYIESQEDA